MTEVPSQQESASPMDHLLEQTPAVVPTPIPEDDRRMRLGGRSLREHAARGVLITTAFMVGLNILALVKSFALARFLTPSDYGLFGIVAVTIFSLARLRDLGVGEKYVQQDEPDQELAFQKAFTVGLVLTVISSVLLVAVLPLAAAVYGHPEMVLPGVVLVFTLAASVFHLPLMIFNRRMAWVKVRALTAIDPVVGFVVSIGLAVAGAGYWALFLGLTAGAWSAAIAAVVSSPYKLRLRYDRATLREYWQFSWPMLVGGTSVILLGQGAFLSTEAALGIAAAGALTLAMTITQFTDQVDQLVSGTLYPAICAVKDRTDLLMESFVKSNRLALILAFPFGVGVSLFCSDLVRLGIGEKWRPAVPLLQVLGVASALGHIGFNWGAYFKARGQTKPTAIAVLFTAIVFLATGIPLLFLYGLRGLAIGIALQVVTHVCFRAYFLRRLFDGFAFLRHALRAVLPSVPAVAAVLSVRVAAPHDRSAGLVALEIGLYLAITVIATWWLERPLLREVYGYVRRRRTVPASA